MDLKQAPYIDMHTHQVGNNPDGIIRVRNVFAQDFPTEETANPISVGLHPWHINQETMQQNLKNVELAVHQKNVIAIGETGLDRAIDIPLDLQKNVLESHLNIAAKYKKPIIIHAVRTYPDIIEVYKKTGLNLKMIFHGFNGNDQIAQQLTSRGFYLSFGENLIQDKKNTAEVFRNIPMENIFLETDESQRSIAEIYDRAADLKKMTPDALKIQIHKNFINCFGAP